MDPVRNPFAPGAGSRPPELAGREAVLEAASLALQRLQRGRPEKSLVLLGLRGVGKTVLLARIAELADQLGACELVCLEAPEGQSLAAYLVPALKAALVRLSRVEQARQLALQALGTLRSFAAVFKVSVGELRLGVTPPPLPQLLADSGNLEVDLPELLLAAGLAAQAAGGVLVLQIDEVQYLSEEELRSLIVALHRVSQKGLPVILFAAGLPQVAGLAGEAKSYAERLFQFQTVGALPPDAAALAIAAPIQDEGAAIEANALAELVERPQGYPYFLQEWGKHTWNVAPTSPITLADVRAADATATAALDQSFFRVRFDRLTPKEQTYLRAMASLGPGPHRSGAIATASQRKVEALAPLRTGLIRKGMIWSPAHGQTAFTVPMFEAFMQRAMPEL